MGKHGKGQGGGGQKRKRSEEASSLLSLPSEFGPRHRRLVVEEKEKLAGTCQVFVMQSRANVYASATVG